MTDVIESSTPQTKKRGRKPKKLLETKEESTNAKTTESTPVILQLNVSEKSDDVPDSSTDINYDRKFCDYDPTVRVPNAYNENNTFESQPFELLEPKEKENSIDMKNARLMLYENETLFPTKSEHACYWCCHKFDSKCLGLPVKYKSNVFYVVGNFCSMECICAHNFDTNNNVNNMWEVYNLLNFMARKMNYTEVVYPAPPRKCLTIFGGYLSVEEFRIYCKSNKIVNYNNVPLVAVVDQVEEINNFYHKHHKHESIQIDVDRIKNYETKLKLQQNAYINDNYENTLNNTMGITTCS
tara:strand:+ start:661 stop:1551 length:891 start_codon:yes stop_codon:yes gene_type:complete